jgi:hypothetical protein
MESLNTGKKKPPVLDELEFCLLRILTKVFMPNPNSYNVAARARYNVCYPQNPTPKESKKARTARKKTGAPKQAACPADIPQFPPDTDDEKRAYRILPSEMSSLVAAQKDIAVLHKKQEATRELLSQGHNVTPVTFEHPDRSFAVQLTAQERYEPHKQPFHECPTDSSYEVYSETGESDWTDDATIRGTPYKFVNQPVPK